MFEPSRDPQRSRPARRHRRVFTALLIVLVGILATALAAGAASAPRVADQPAAPAAPAAVASGSPDLSGLHVAGGTLQNGAGQVVQLRGVNRSSWEYTCLDGSGQTHDGGADLAEVSALQAWHINVVRVVLNEDCWLGINGVSVGGAAYQSAVSSYVSLLTQHNIAAIVNLHFSAPGSILAGKYSAGDQFPMPDRDHSPAFWSSVAARFAGNSRVLLEPYNEPFPDDNAGGNTPAAWRCWRDGGSCPAVSGFPDYVNAGMAELVTAIRSTGAANVIILTGTNWGSELSQWRTYLPADPLGQLAVGWHSYGDGLSCQTASCWNSTLTPLLQAYPLVATELGEFDCQHGYLDQVLGYLDSQQQSYTAWAWGPYNCSQDPALISDWSGTPTQSYGQGFHDHLLAAAGTGTPPPSATPTRTPTTAPTAPPTRTLTTSPSPTRTPSPTTTPSSTATPPPTRTATPSPTATPVSTASPASTRNPTPTAPPSSQTSTTVYGDALATGWSECSWDAVVDLANASPVYQGSRSIAFTAGAAWSGLQLCVNQPIASASTSISFAANASSVGQSYGVWLANARGNRIGRELSLAGYGGQPATGAWKVYTIPLKDFGVGASAVYGITIEELLGKAQPALFIDNVVLK